MRAYAPAVSRARFAYTRKFITASKHTLPCRHTHFRTLTLTLTRTRQHLNAAIIMLSKMLGSYRPEGGEALDAAAAEEEKTEDGDIKCRCRDCQGSFLFAAKEQKFYDKKGWPRPLRCKECRKNKNIAPRNPNKAPRRGGPGGAKNSGEGGDEKKPKKQRKFF